jgi:hypothetical protein
MFKPELTASVLDFTKIFASVPDVELDRPWPWKGNDEGVRFAFFVVNLELRELAVRLNSQCNPMQPVEQILSQYHAAFLDLQAALYGLSDEDANLAPSEKDWTLKRLLAHIVSTEIGFTAVIRHALKGHRAAAWTTAPMTAKDGIELTGLSETEYGELMQGSYKNLLSYHQTLHSQITTEFSHISTAELDLPAIFWEPEPFPIRYRLHRYESHLRQHIIQIDKTLPVIQRAPSEVRRLIRMLYAAQAEVDGILIAGSDSLQTCQPTINTINVIAGEIAQILADFKPAHSADMSI